MRNGRKLSMRAAVAAGSGLVLAATLTASPSAADPETPSLSEAQREVAKLSHEAEQANERYLELKTEVDGATKQIKKLRADVKAQQAEVDEVRNALAKTVTERLSSSPMGPTTQLLASDDVDEFLEGLTALQSYNSTQADRLAAFEREAGELKVRREQLSAKLEVISDAEKEMKKQKAKLDDRVDKAEALVASLTPAEREEVYDNDHGGTTRGDDRPSTSAPKVNASGRAKKAIDFALAQLGEPYSYGAAGPSSWDCSGLTMAAFGAAGVSLPHSSSAQSGMGSSVSRSSMSPGDLVFYYSPVSHVGIYIGNGKLVHAPRPGRSVEIVSVDLMPISGVRRVG
ncbi:NlpC/P60 family protein [Mumia sp. DW29H23]|uniref:C40 family peptidase n=1 Tax=Mumia sp. DW29H23 TaxID=3421241 RepID=UPI003D6936B5